MTLKISPQTKSLIGGAVAVLKVMVAYLLKVFVILTMFAVAIMVGTGANAGLSWIFNTASRFLPPLLAGLVVVIVLTAFVGAAIWQIGNGESK